MIKLHIIFNKITSHFVERLWVRHKPNGGFCSTV